MHAVMFVTRQAKCRPHPRLTQPSGAEPVIQHPGVRAFQFQDAWLHVCVDRHGEQSPCAPAHVKLWLQGACHCTLSLNIGLAMAPRLMISSSSACDSPACAASAKPSASDAITVPTAVPAHKRRFGFRSACWALPMGTGGRIRGALR